MKIARNDAMVALYWNSSYSPDVCTLERFIEANALPADDEALYRIRHGELVLFGGGASCLVGVQLVP